MCNFTSIMVSWRPLKRQKFTLCIYIEILIKFWWFSGSTTQYVKYESIEIDHKVYLGFWNIQEVLKLRFKSVLCCKRTAVNIWVIISLSNGVIERPRAFRGRLSTGEKAVTPIIATHLCPHQAHARLICAPSGKTLFTQFQNNCSAYNLKLLKIDWKAIDFI